MGNNLNYLIKPSTETVYEDGTVEISPTSSLKLGYGVATMQGWRKKQEDKFTCLPNIYKEFSFFGVYDGHGGSEIAEYLQENLHLGLKHFLETEDDVELALYLTFLAADATLTVPEIIAELNSKLDSENADISIDKRKKLFHRVKLLEEMKKKHENDSSSAGVAEVSGSAGGVAEVSSSGGVAESSSSGGVAEGSSSGGVAEGSSSGGVAKGSSFAGVAEGSSFAGVAQDCTSAVVTQDTSSSGVTEDSSSGTNQEAGSSGATQHPNPNIDMAAAGPSQEWGSSTEEEIEMEDDSTEEEMEVVIMGATNEVEQPIDYLLHDELESTDPEDEDFSYDDEETESECSDEGMKSRSTDSKLTAEEFVNIQPGDLSGSTATVVLLNEKTMYVANVGDSRCVLSRKGVAMDMTIDHKPTDEEECERIERNGGFVRMGRVNDTIDMSRAIGDFKLKNNTLIPYDQLVTAEPTVTTLIVDSDDEFLVIASDGIWNAMKSQEVVDYIRMRLRQDRDCDLRDISNEMFQLILSPDLENDGTGCDNMTCIIIKFIHSASN